MISALCRQLLRVFGWQSVFVPPPSPKSVIMVYPHTSNWDFPLGILFRATCGLPIQFGAKDSWFRWPFKTLGRYLGGVPINRRHPAGIIDQLARNFAERESFHFCLAPEGTRAKMDHLKSGFYRLALAAKVPLGLGFIDYQHKKVGIERWIILSGNSEQDLQTLRDYYAEMKAYYPEKSSIIRFKTPPK